jgi:large-conductance mechanosensitive channel
MEEQNPYEPPKSSTMPTPDRGTSSRRARAWTFGAWIFVCAINLAVPLLFSATLIEAHGKIGMMLAIVSFFFCGCCLCAFQRDLALAVIIGGVFVALTQLFPILHIVAGWIGVAVGDALGLADFGSGDKSPRLLSEFGGFVVTLITGGILMAVATGIGLAIQWFRSRRRMRRSQNSSIIS